MIKDGQEVSKYCLVGKRRSCFILCKFRQIVSDVIFMFTRVVDLITCVVMSNGLRISESEWKVMEVVWLNPPVSSQQVVGALCEVESWKPQTVKTLLSRLVKKGALSAEAEGNRFLYSPILKREAAVKEETKSFLDRVSRGSLAPMLTQLVGKRPLSDEEIQSLRNILDEAQKVEDQ